MTIEIACIVAVAFFWGGWPLVSRSAGMGGPFASLLLSLFSLVPITLFALWEGAERPPSETLGKLAIAGTMMGLGLVAFNIVANSKMEASVSIPMIDASMLLVSTAGALYFFGESVSAQKLAGIGLLVAGIALLRPTG